MRLPATFYACKCRFSRGVQTPLQTGTDPSKFYLFQILEDYVFHNGLIIDKSMYMTVITGQITIYGILLAIKNINNSVSN